MYNLYPGVLELAWCCVYCVLYCIVPVIIAICEFGQIGRVPAPPRPRPALDTRLMELFLLFLSHVQCGNPAHHS